MSTSHRRAETIDRASLLNEAVELAFVSARRDSSTAGAPPPPSALRPVLSFARLPPRARRTVYQVVDTDEEFRERVVEGLDESAVERSTWLFLARPPGWESDLELLIDAAADDAAQERADQQEQSAQRRVARLEEAEARLQREARAAETALASAESAAAEERTRRLAAERDLARSTERLGSLEEDLARAVRSLTDSKTLASTRLDALRAAEEQVADLQTRLAEAREVAASEERTALPVSAAPSPEAPPRQRSPWDDADPAAVAAAVAAASAAAEALGVALASAARSLVEVASDTPGEMASENATAEPPDRPRVSPRPTRRTPVRLRAGAVDGTIDGIDQLLRTPGVVVMVDGYNVSMSGWPSLDRRAQRDTLVAALGATQVRTGANVHVVFDGVADGGRPAVAAPLPVRVHFSPEHTEADDMVLDMVQRTSTDVAVVVVSSDRRVQDGARRLGANVVASEAMLEYLRR